MDHLSQLSSRERCSVVFSGALCDEVDWLVITASFVSGLLSECVQSRSASQQTLIWFDPVCIWLDLV